jgi:hypothetical protein
MKKGRARLVRECKTSEEADSKIEHIAVPTSVIQVSENDLSPNESAPATRHKIFTCGELSSSCTTAAAFDKRATPPN